MTHYLPMFPLDLVLFPEMLLPLHIFEERYREMIGECLQAKSPFGILYAHDETVETIGCTAEISKVIKRYPDGRLDIVVVGLERFQVSLFDSQRSYLRGSIEPFADIVPDGEPSQERAIRTLDLYRQAFQLMNRSDADEIAIEASYIGLSFRIASVLYLNNTVKQQVLAARSEDERLDVLSSHLSDLVPRLRESYQAAKQAGANGNLRLSGSQPG